MEMPEAFAENCAEHYMKAVEKHPYFADRLFLLGDEKKASQMLLLKMRLFIDYEKRESNVLAETILNCELAEAAYAFVLGDKAHAIDELYDAIAVLMRMIAVLEGKQKLGKE